MYCSIFHHSYTIYGLNTSIIYSRLFGISLASTFMSSLLMYILMSPSHPYKTISISMTRQPRLLLWHQFYVFHSQNVQELRNRNLGIEFSWYKHHSLDHAIDIIRKKGPTDNYEPGLGESLHPQVKVDYERSNRQPGSADIQVCCTR